MMRKDSNYENNYKNSECQMVESGNSIGQHHRVLSKGRRVA